MYFQGLAALCIGLLTSFIITERNQEVKVDSNISLQEALKGKDAPLNITNDLIILDVESYSFHRVLH